MGRYKIIIVGGFHEVIELCERCLLEIVGIIDNRLHGKFCGYTILGSDEDAFVLYEKYGDCKLVLTPDSPQIREKLYYYYSQIGFQFATIISPNARISNSAYIGEGTIVQDGVNVSSDTQIGKCCKLNTNSNIMHDNQISDFVTIAPNAVSLGYIKIGMRSYIGANSTLLPYVNISSDVIVGAGAVVTKDVTNNVIVKGVPAK
jgi:sugar O-acyltransferase (sialic acid O-acetyltransferase NeuD family)